MEAKAIPYVVFSNEKVVLSEAKKLITIGCDLKANLRINHPSVASVQCILKIRKTDNMHYVKELDFETVIKNGQNRKTFVNSKQLDWDEKLVLNNNDKIYIKVEEDIFDGSNNDNKIGKSCIVKKVRSNNCSDKNIYAAKVIHVNIKPDNIMFTDSNFNQVRLIDFGESKKIEGSIDSMGNYIEQTNTDLVGTPLFVVPELAKAFKDRIAMFTTDNDSDGDTSQYEYDKSIDIWSFGIVNYYMLSKKYPWNVNNHVKGVEGRSKDCIELYDNIMKGDLGFSTFKTTRSDINEIKTVVDFILKLCQVDKDQRMSS
ncbi:11348_t:CDS:2 [Entrophospora sp. SA101]|nr:11348_t:CDS:2 [Entrophospora sp. SA101]